MSFDLTQEEATNKLLLDMVRKQREYINSLVKIFVITISCYTLILISVIACFVYN